jgi:hypothetical protein
MATELRLRAFLTPDEVAALLRAAKKGRHGARNHAMILIAYQAAQPPYGTRNTISVRLRVGRGAATGKGRAPSAVTRNCTGRLPACEISCSIAVRVEDKF